MRSGLMYLPLFRLPLLPILLCSAGVAEAVALGKMTVLSHLGSRFEAEVQLLDTAAGKQPLAECFRLGQRGQSGESDIPLLTRARLTVEQRGSGLRLHIVSEQTISEPVLQVNLHAGCGAEVVHKYLLLVDPPLASKPPVDLPAVRMAAVAEPVSRQRPATNSPPGTPDSQVLAAARPVTNPGAASAGDTQTGLPPERQLPRKPFPGYGATDRLLLSGGADSPQPRIADDLPLRLSTRLSAQLLNKTTDNQRSMLRIEYQLLSALHTQAEQQLVVAEQVRRLDAALNDLQRKSLGQSSKQQTFVAAAVPAAHAPAGHSAIPDCGRAGSASEREQGLVA
jgi:pilus assembly protein FimV